MPIPETHCRRVSRVIGVFPLALRPLAAQAFERVFREGLVGLLERTLLMRYLREMSFFCSRLRWLKAQAGAGRGVLAWIPGSFAR